MLTLGSHLSSMDQGCSSTGINLQTWVWRCTCLRHCALRSSRSENIKILLRPLDHLSLLQWRCFCVNTAAFLSPRYLSYHIIQHPLRVSTVSHLFHLLVRAQYNASYIVGRQEIPVCDNGDEETAWEKVTSPTCVEFHFLYSSTPTQWNVLGCRHLEPRAPAFFAHPAGLSLESRLLTGVAPHTGMFLLVLDVIWE